ncbi:MAG: murein biosynthesis integral membrane protein MurJ [Betaproteobacteria bacterium]|nr:murein biosynthesis integral membrane protein MurJ [Betaproteobacteria bacterium]PWB65803.1 MAG: murein biosynthesis integral membrane protein MurJ [Betaproteobacteria bacterium]
MNLLKAAASVSAMTLLSRITGFVRDTLLAVLFGAGLAMDAFVVAFRLPNLLRRLFAEGAFSQAFIPILGEYRNRRGEEATRELSARVLGSLSVALLAATAVGVVAAPLLVYASAWGFAKDADKFALTVTMLRICFPYIFFISLTSFAAGILNTWGSFKVPAFTPVLLNLSFIGFAVVAAPHFERPIVALAWAVFAGGILQLAFQVPFLLRIRMLPAPKWDPRDEGVVRILKLMAPAALGVSVAQVSLVINTHIASWLGDGPVSWLYYADRLMEFPSALLGVALGTVILPSLVKHHANQDPEAYSRLLDWGLRLTLLLALPAAVGLALLAVPIIATLFWHGEFTRHDVMMTRAALIAYAVGLAGIILVKILAPGFYARQNIRTPVKVALVTLAVTQLANAALVPWLKHAGLAAAISVGATFNAAWLWWLTKRGGHWRAGSDWGAFLLKIAVALYMMGGVIWYGMGPEHSWFGLPTAARALKLSLVVAGAMAAYFATLWALGLRLRQFARNE